jgi:glycosyltransferase involved in cell wall biosynthesis
LAIDMAAILRHEGIAQHLSAEGSKMARENFSWTEIANKLLDTVSRKSFNG